MMKLLKKIKNKEYTVYNDKNLSIYQERINV